MNLFALLLSPKVVVSPLDGPSFPLKMCRGLAEKVEVQTGLWTNGVYAVEFTYKSPLTVQELAKLYRREVPGSPKGSFSHNSYHFDRFRGSVFQDCWITKNYGPLGPKITTIQITETPNPTMPPPRRWYRQAISLKPPASLIRVPFEPSVTSNTVFPLFRAITSTKSPPYRREGFIFNAHLPEPLASVSRKAVVWFAAHGYRMIRAHEWFKPHVSLFEIGLMNEPFPGTPKGTRVTMCLSSTDNNNPIPYDPPKAAKS
jgi:hypothetical protein